MLHVRTHSIPRRRSSELDETIRRDRAEMERLMPMLGAPAQWEAATLREAFERRSKEIPGSTALLATIMRSYLRFLIRSEEHTSELQSLMRISYAVFCLKKKKINIPQI